MGLLGVGPPYFIPLVRPPFAHSHPPMAIFGWTKLPCASHSRSDSEIKDPSESQGHVHSIVSRPRRTQKRWTIAVGRGEHAQLRSRATKGTVLHHAGSMRDIAVQRTFVLINVQLIIYCHRFWVARIFRGGFCHCPPPATPFLRVLITWNPPGTRNPVSGRSPRTESVSPARLLGPQASALRLACGQSIAGHLHGRPFSMRVV